MPLIKPTLTQSILSLLTEMRNRTDVSDSYFAEQLATMIDTYIKSATITIAAGIPVSTAGGPTSQTGTTVAPATATIQ